MKNNQLRIKIGPIIGQDFQVFIGEEDVTEKLMIKAVEMKADADGGLLRVMLDVYTDNIEIIPGELVLRTEEWPPKQTLWQRFTSWWATKYPLPS